MIDLDRTIVPPPPPPPPVAPLGGDGDGWLRLHPRSLLLTLVKSLQSLIRSLPALIGIGVMASWMWVLPALGLLLAVSLLREWFKWRRFRYRITDDAVEVEHGLLSRQHRIIPFERIQDVSIEEPLLIRALGLARVRLETGSGGADGEEASFDAIDRPAADALRHTVRARRAGIAARHGGTAGAEATTDVAAHGDADDPLLYAMPPRRVVTLGLFNFSLVFLAVLFGLFQTLDDVLPWDPFSRRFWIDLLAQNAALTDLVRAHAWLSAAAGLVTIVLLGAATGVVTTALREWGFTLTRTPTGLRRRRGLTTRTDVVIPVRKVQAAQVRTNPVRRHWGWFALVVQSLARDGEKEPDHSIAPLATQDEVGSLLGEVAMAAPPPDAAWHRVHPAVTAWVPIPMMAFVGVGSTGLWFDQPVAAALFAVPLLLIGLGWAEWRATRWHYDGRQLSVRRGWWRQHLTLLPAASVQSAELSIGPVLRRFGLATLTLGVAGGTGHDVPALSEPTARALRQALLARKPLS